MINVTNGLDAAGGIIVPEEIAPALIKLLKIDERIMAEPYPVSLNYKQPIEGQWIEENTMKLVTFLHCTLNVEQIVRFDYVLKTLSEDLSLADLHGIEVEIFTSDGKVLVMNEDEDLHTVAQLFRHETMGEKSELAYYIERLLEYRRIAAKNLKGKK